MSLYYKQCKLTSIRFYMNNELQYCWTKKTLEVEPLEEAVEYAQSRSWIVFAPCNPRKMDKRLQPEYRCEARETEYHGSSIFWLAGSQTTPQLLL